MTYTEVFERAGRYGLRREGELVLPPAHRSIGPFVGGYALVDGEFFVDSAGHQYHWRGSRRRSGEKPVELIPGGFGKVVSEEGRVLYLDFVTDLLWTECPDGFTQLDFLHFFTFGGLYYLRVAGFSRPLAFCADDIWLRGDAFQRRDVCDAAGAVVFVHRSMPATVFEFCGYTADMSKRLRPLNADGSHYYIYRRGGKRPVRTCERVLPVDTDERRGLLADSARQERDIQCSLRMKRLWGEAGSWL